MASRSRRFPRYAVVSALAVAGIVGALTAAGLAAGWSVVAAEPRPAPITRSPEGRPRGHDDHDPALEAA